MGNRDMLAGIQPAKEDTKAAAIMDHLAQGMLDRGFSSLWTRPANPNKVTFGDKEKRIYLIKLASTGRKALSAATAGTSRTTVQVHCRADPVFAAACDEATEYFRDILVGEMYRRGVEGFEQEVIGGRNKDQIFKIKNYSDKMLDTLGRIHIKEMQKDNGPAVTVHETKIINNQFDMENMPAADMAMVKQLLQNQQKRLDEAAADADAIEGKVSTDG